MWVNENTWILMRITQAQMAICRKKQNENQSYLLSRLWQKEASPPTAGDGQGYWLGRTHSVLPGKENQNLQSKAYKQAASFS